MSVIHIWCGFLFILCLDSHVTSRLNLTCQAWQSTVLHQHITSNIHLQRLHLCNATSYINNANLLQHTVRDQCQACEHPSPSQLPRRQKSTALSGGNHDNRAFCLSAELAQNTWRALLPLEVPIKPAGIVPQHHSHSHVRYNSPLFAIVSYIIIYWTVLMETTHIFCEIFCQFTN